MCGLAGLRANFEYFVAKVAVPQQGMPGVPGVPGMPRRMRPGSEQGCQEKFSGNTRRPGKPEKQDTARRHALLTCISLGLDWKSNIPSLHESCGGVTLII